VVGLEFTGAGLGLGWLWNVEQADKRMKVETGSVYFKPETDVKRKVSLKPPKRPAIKPKQGSPLPWNRTLQRSAQATQKPPVDCRRASRSASAAAGIDPPKQKFASPLLEGVSTEAAGVTPVAGYSARSKALFLGKMRAKLPS